MTRAPQTRRLATRDRLIAAARDIVVERGMAALRTEEVVARAEVAKGTFFSHFPDKDHLLAILTAERLSALLARHAPVPDLAAFEATLAPYLTMMAAEPQIVQVMARFSGPDGAGLGLDDAVCALIDRLAADIAALQAKGAARPVPEAALLAEGLLAFLFSAAASAQCTTGEADSAAALADARTKLARMVQAWLQPA